MLINQNIADPILIKQAKAKELPQMKIPLDHNSILHNNFCIIARYIFLIFGMDGWKVSMRVNLFNFEISFPQFLGWNKKVSVRVNLNKF